MPTSLKAAPSSTKIAAPPATWSALPAPPPTRSPWAATIGTIASIAGAKSLRCPPVTSPHSAMKVGEMSSYSSPGYRRIGSAVKPEVTSPGQWYTAPAPMNVAADRDTTGQYQQFNGTSAATPYTAGCVALLFQKKPDADARARSKASSRDPPPAAEQFGARR